MAQQQFSFRTRGGKQLSVTIEVPDNFEAMARVLTQRAIRQGRRKVASLDGQVVLTINEEPGDGR